MLRTLTMPQALTFTAFFFRQHAKEGCWTLLEQDTVTSVQAICEHAQELAISAFWSLYATCCRRMFHVLQHESLSQVFMPSAKVPKTLLLTSCSDFASVSSILQKDVLTFLEEDVPQPQKQAPKLENRQTCK